MKDRLKGDYPAQVVPENSFCFGNRKIIQIRGKSKTYCALTVVIQAQGATVNQ